MIAPTVLLIVALVGGLYMAWNIGANDVANAMGTSVGSGAITLKQAVIIAGIFEFAGAFIVGDGVAQTVGKGIVNMDRFRTGVVNRAPAEPGARSRPAQGATPALEAQPEDSGTQDRVYAHFAVGMLSALLGAALWLNVATFFGQPVSTTHAIVGSVVGFAIVAAGPGCIVWPKMGIIASSWVISPIAGGLLAYIIYRMIQRFVLHSEDPVSRAKKAVPLGFAAVVFVMALSIVYKVMHLGEAGLWKALPVAIIAALFAGAIARAVLVRKTRDQDVPAGESYQVVERWFSRIQPVSACYLAFAHGANDVANAIGPLAAVVHYCTGGAMEAERHVPLWLLAMGGVGIVLGVMTYGYKVIQSIGKRITEITPTRGYSAEFGTATSVLVCSMLGLPISTTLVLVGAVMGVGLARGFGAIDLKVLKRIFASWAITIPVSAGFSAVIYITIMALLG